MEQSRPESESLEGAPCYLVEEQPRRNRSPTRNGNGSRKRSKRRKYSSGPDLNEFENPAREAVVEKNEQKSRLDTFSCSLQ